MLRDPLSPESVLPWETDLTVKPAADNLPGVSIVIPIYNAGGFLEKTLRSLLCNDLSGVEIILMDGGSTDNTRDIVAHYKDMFAVTVFEKDRGQSDAINKGFARATKPVLYWLNGDDIILPNTLNAARQAFRDNPEAGAVVGNAYMTEIDFTPINHFVFSPEKLEFSYLLDYARHHLVQPSVFFTRAAWEAAGPCREELHYAMDADLFLGMAAQFGFVYLPVDIAYSVYHEGCKTRGKRGESITELAMVQARHGGFDEARKTLDILVGLYNEATEGGAGNGQDAAEPAAGGQAAEIWARRFRALEAEVAANRQQLIDDDIRITEVTA